jgi:phosphoribosyl transferase-like protein
VRPPDGASHAPTDVSETFENQSQMLLAAVGSVSFGIAYVIASTRTDPMLKHARDLRRRRRPRLPQPRLPARATSPPPRRRARLITHRDAFVRKPGYRGHEVDEPPVRGADVRGRRVLLVDDAVSSGASLERFAGELADEGAELAGAFVLVDMRDVAEAVIPFACAVATESVSTYLHVLDLAADHGILAPVVHELSVSAIVDRWAEDDPRWEALIAVV